MKAEMGLISTFTLKHLCGEKKNVQNIGLHSTYVQNIGFLCSNNFDGRSWHNPRLKMKN